MSCVFCKIVAGDIPAEKVYEDDRILAFKDIAPSAPVHILFIPKQHIASLQVVPLDHGDVLAHILLTITKVAKEAAVDVSGYRVQTNIGEDGGQVVPHLHFHLLGGKKLGGN